MKYFWLVKKLNYRIQRISKDRYAFSIWQEDQLLFLYTGNARIIKKRAREFDWDISLKMDVLNRPDYELDHICG